MVMMVRLLKWVKESEGDARDGWNGIIRINLLWLINNRFVYIYYYYFVGWRMLVDEMKLL